MSYQAPINSLKTPNNPFRPSNITKQSQLGVGEQSNLNININNKNNSNNNNNNYPARLSPRSQQNQQLQNNYKDYNNNNGNTVNSIINHNSYKTSLNSQTSHTTSSGSNHVPNFIKNNQIPNNQLPNSHKMMSQHSNKPLPQKKLINSGNNLNIDKLLSQPKKQKVYRPSMHQLSDTGNQWKNKKQEDSINSKTNSNNLNMIKQSYMPNAPNYSQYQEMQTHHSFIMNQDYKNKNQLPFNPINFKLSPNKEENRNKTTGSLSDGIQSNHLLTNNQEVSQKNTLNHQSYQQHGKFVPQFIKKGQSHNQPKTFQKIGYGRTSPKAHKKTDSKLEKKFPTIDNFIRIKDLGSGQYGSVFLARQKTTGFICAIKQIKKKHLIQQGIVDQFIRQIKIQKYLNHPNILKLYTVMYNQTYIYLILQAGLDKQLQKFMQAQVQLSERKTAMFMRQICSAVQALHSQQIIHRDLKPQNIVLHQNVVKLCDFGWAVHHDNSLRTTFCGTPKYVSPQILKGNEYDEKVDIWSLGIMMYQMVIGQNPFRITRQQDLRKIIVDQVVIPSSANLSKQCINFLQLCLKKKSSQRTNIREMLEHDFFKKYPQKSTQKNKMLD